MATPKKKAVQAAVVKRSPGLFGGPGQQGAGTSVAAFYAEHRGAAVKAAAMLKASRGTPSDQRYTGANSVQNTILNSQPRAKAAYLAGMGKEIVGGRVVAMGSGGGTGTSGRRAHAAAMGGVTKDAVNSTSFPLTDMVPPQVFTETGYTGLKKAYGSQATRGAFQPGMSEVTKVPKMTPKADVTKAGGQKKKGKQKANLKVRGHRQQSGVAPGKHINKQGVVVKNKGGKKK